jgi:hypothetical protein
MSVDRNAVAARNLDFQDAHTIVLVKEPVMSWCGYQRIQTHRPLLFDRRSRHSLKCFGFHETSDHKKRN